MAGAARHIPAAPGGSQGCRRAEGKRSRTARRLAGNNILESTGDLARGDRFSPGVFSAALPETYAGLGAAPSR
jgi:hypothetical protein